MIPDLRALVDRPDVARALEHVRGSDAATVSDMVTVAQIPAPTGAERARGEWLRARLSELGLEADFDAAGNVIARWPSTPAADAQPIVLAAHLDTVFPPTTELSVVHENGLLRGPGIADNARGLAALVALARALCAAAWVSPRPLAFVGTVGEEGAGNLRGVRHLLRPGAALRDAAAFVAIDGSGRRHVVTRALGSVRLRFEVRGAGGHSWADRGRPNPLQALAAAIVAVRQRAGRGVALAPTRMGGGDSINAIPELAWLEVDVRAREAERLAEAEASVRLAVDHAVSRENRRGRPGSTPLQMTVLPIGHRPIGALQTDSPLVRIATAATRALGEEPEFTTASTDANVPLALGIPAVAMGAGGRSGATHTTAEWYDNDGGPQGIQRLLLTVIALGEMR